MADVDLSLIAPSGTELSLASSIWDAGAFRVMDGTSGLGLPVQLAAFTESAGDGRRLGNVRTSGRQINLVVGIFEETRAAVQARIDELADHLAHADGLPLPRLRATYADGTAREIEFVHSGGGTAGLTAMGDTATVLPLVLDCVSAYFTDVNFQSFTVAQAQSSQTFLESLPNVFLLPSGAVGSIQVTNPGKAPSFVEWELKGPFTRLRAECAGQAWEFAAPLAAGETVFIRKTSAGITVTDATGANRYASVADAPRFFQLPPGTSTLLVTIEGTSTETRAIARYKPRYRQVF
ncbi:hypothetical protein [Microbacterium sp.]|uniref:hypothetical protein n=1 Tax=Microbacterium sp. TaxID=51671 RepID=UPI003241E648